MAYDAEIAVLAAPYTMPDIN